MKVTKLPKLQKLPLWYLSWLQTIPPTSRSKRQRKMIRTHKFPR